MSRVKFTFAFLGMFIINSSSQESWIRINQLGYTQKSVKVAVFGTKQDTRIRSTEIVNILGDEVVFRSKEVRSYGVYAQPKL